MKQQQTQPRRYQALGKAQHPQQEAVMQTPRVPALFMLRVKQLAAVQAVAANRGRAEAREVVASITTGSGRRTILVCVTRT
jgi:hypothetical protein